MKTILNDIIKSAENNSKLLAILIDPDKLKLEILSSFVDKINSSIITHVFIGGSTVKNKMTQQLVSAIKPLTNLPVILFPGDLTQVSNDADAILFLSLVSGRNPEYLIGQHVKSIVKLRNTNLEIIPTGYILIEGRKETATQLVTNTKPLDIIDEIVDTAKASELLGQKLIYLEAGSGAKKNVSSTIIKAVKQDITIPLIVGGGIKSKMQLENAYKAGADIVVIGTAFEEDESFFEKIKPYCLSDISQRENKNKFNK